MKQDTLQELCSENTVDINYALEATQEPVWKAIDILLRRTGEVESIRADVEQNEFVRNIAENNLVAKTIIWLKAFRDVAKGLMETNSMHYRITKKDGLYYHTWEHHIEYMERFVFSKLLPFNNFVLVEPCVSQLQRFEYKPFSIDLLKTTMLAVWFHDSHFVVGYSHNEEDSAWMLHYVWSELHEKFLGEGYIEQPSQKALLTHACDIILLTAYHDRVQENIVSEPTNVLSPKICAGIVLDADLAGIAYSTMFNRSNMLLELESCKPQSDKLIKLKFIHNLLGRSNIYYQSPELENAARVNLIDYETSIIRAIRKSPVAKNSSRK